MATIDGKQTAYIVGKGYIIDIGNLPPEELNKIKNMSEEARQNYINNMIKDIPEAYKEWSGFCTKIEKHVKLLDCIRCARFTQGFTSTKEWEACKVYYLSKP